MANGLKRLGISVAALIGGVVLALTLVSWLVDKAQVVAAVERQIHSATGLDFVLRDGADVSLFPGGTVTFRNAMLKGDGRDEAALSVAEIAVNLRTLPLATGRFEIADVTLTGPRLTVTRNGDNTNWTGILATLARSLKPGPDKLVSFSEIRIKDGTLLYHDRARDIIETLSGIDLSLAWPSISRTFGATGQFSWRGKPIDASVTLADFVAALSGQRSGLKMRLAAAPLKLAFDGTLATQPNLIAEGTLTADSPSFREVLTWAEREPFTPEGLGRFALKARASVNGATVNLANVNLELDGNTAEGVLSFSGNGRRALQGTLAVEALNLTPYIAPARRMTTQARDWSRRAIDMSALSALDVDMRLSAATVALGSARLGRTALSLNTAGGALTLSVAETQVFGGLGKGSLTMTPAAEKQAAVKTQFQLIDVDLEASLAELLSIRKLSGRGTLSVALDSAGASPYDFAQSLGGTAVLTGRGGALNGVNVEQLLRRLERRPLSGTGDFRSGRTPFETIAMTLRFNEGLATTDDIRMEGPTVRMAMAGTVSAPLRELDLKGSAALIGVSSDPNGFELPFVVQGPWDNPIILPDTEVLLQRSPASAPLFNSVRERKTRDTLRNALERLTGPSQSAPAAVPGPSSPPAAQN